MTDVRIIVIVDKEDAKAIIKSLDDLANGPFGKQMTALFGKLTADTWTAPKTVKAKRAPQK